MILFNNFDLSRKRVWKILEPAEEKDKLSKLKLDQIQKIQQ